MVGVCVHNQFNIMIGDTKINDLVIWLTNNFPLKEKHESSVLVNISDTFAQCEYLQKYIGSFLLKSSMVENLGRVAHFFHCHAAIHRVEHLVFDPSIYY